MKADAWTGQFLIHVAVILVWVRNVLWEPQLGKIRTDVENLPRSHINGAKGGNQDCLSAHLRGVEGGRTYTTHTHVYHLKCVNKRLDYISFYGEFQVWTLQEQITLPALNGNRFNSIKIKK